MKLNVGNKVKVRTWDNMLTEFSKSEFGGIQLAPATVFTSGMRIFCGREVTIQSVYPDSRYPNTFFYLIEEDGGLYVWLSEMFEAPNGAHKANSGISSTGFMCTTCHSNADLDAVFCKYCGAKFN